MQLLNSFQVEPLLVVEVVLEAANHPIAAVAVDPTAVAAASEELQALQSLVEVVQTAWNPTDHLHDPSRALEVHSSVLVDPIDPEVADYYWVQVLLVVEEDHLFQAQHR